MSVSPALARMLAEGRPGFNARVAAARSAQTGFDTAAFAVMLQDALDPIVMAVEAVAPERLGAVVDAAFDMAITLVGRGLAGPKARGDAVNRLWEGVAPAFAAALAEEPFAVLGALTNAALHIAGTPGADVSAWLDRMKAVAPLATAATLPAIGQVVAWRCGMAHYREGALAAADGLPPETALAAIGAGGDWAEVRAALRASRWWTPEPVPEAGVTVGGFTGLGGPFASPPEVRACAEGFLLRSGARVELAIADAFGATLHASTPEDFRAADAQSPRVDGNRVAAGDRTVVADLPAQGLTAAANADSLAVASPFSYSVRIFAWRRP
ncbi:MAG: hypothetical protein V4574_20630 [Pseudomonadota bacterium]